MIHFAKKLNKMATVLLWHMLFNYRFKTLTVIFFLSILLISCGIIYHSITTNAYSHYHPQHDIQVLDKRAYKKHSKYKESLTQNELQQFRNDLIFANLMPNKINPLHKIELTKPGQKELVINYVKGLNPINWEAALDTDEAALDLKYLLIECGFESKMSCKQIDDLVLGDSIRPLQSKFVDYAYEAVGQTKRSLENRFGIETESSKQLPKPNLIIISSYKDLETKSRCMNQTHNTDICESKANYGFLKEVLLLNILHHPGILLLKGYCLRGNRVSKILREKGQIAVTEVGVPFSESLLAACTWSQRVSFALQVTNLLLYLEETPFGSLRFKKLSMHNFVLVRGAIIKLADLNGLEFDRWPCTKDSHCEVAGFGKGGLCKSGLCEGLNALMNLHLAVQEILLPLLQDIPDLKEEDLISRLYTLDITTKELIEELQTLFNKHPPEGPVKFAQPSSGRGNNRNIQVDDYYQRREREREKLRDRKHSVVFTDQKENNSEIMSNFIRHNSENFPGVFDYNCAGSQVSWGCVFTVTKVVDAASLCLQDTLCQSFVALSNKPEIENLLMVVLKNGIDSKPLVFHGTTLYIRQRNNSLAEQETGNVLGKLKKEKVSSGTSLSTARTCMDKTVESQAFFRHFQEKWFLSHLDFKGMRDTNFKDLALRKVTGYSHLNKAEGIGGKFVVNFEDNLPNVTSKAATKINFISEDGPDVSHLAYAVVYQLDRLLGLYHTLPCVGRRLPMETVDMYLKDDVWNSTFKSLIASDGTLLGVMVASLPKSVRKTKLSVKPLRKMTPAIEPFNESSKSHLEYIILLWLSRMSLNRSHLGHKDHLVIFSADRAFTSPEVNMSGYLLNCQFPLNVYQTLECFRCGTDKKIEAGSEVCFLGEEVIQQTLNMFPVGTEILIHGLREENIANMINTAATSALHIIDDCVRTFGSKSVLY